MGGVRLLILGFNLGFFELVISFTILPRSQGHCDSLVHAYTHTNPRATGSILLCFYFQTSEVMVAISLLLYEKVVAAQYMLCAGQIQHILLLLLLFVFPVFGSH